jgi:hypothetical protein
MHRHGVVIAPGSSKHSKSFSELLRGRLIATSKQPSRVTPRKPVLGDESGSMTPLTALLEFGSCDRCTH